MSRKKPSKEILRQVEQEIAEHLLEIESLLLRLDENPEDREAVQELFRHMHTIKGVGGVLDRPAIVEIAHRAENALSVCREGKKSLEKNDLDFLLEAKDLIGRALQGESVTVAETDSEDEDSEPVFLLFRVRKSLCAFPVDQIREVSQLLAWRSIPFTSKSFCGMSSLRGQLVPVLDPAPLLRLTAERAAGGRILFLESEEELVGIYVDRVLGVYPLPGWKGSAVALRHFDVPLVEAVASFKGETVAILSPNLLIETAGK